MNMYSVVSVGEMPDDVKDYTVDGRCSNCGACCGNFIPVKKPELKEIRRYVQKNRIQPQRVVFPFAKQPDVDGSCPFRDAHSQQCTIYLFRPTICRIFRCNRQPTKEEALQLRGAKVVDLRKEIFGIEDKYSGIGILETIRRAAVQARQTR